MGLVGQKQMLVTQSETALRCNILPTRALFAVRGQLGLCLAIATLGAACTNAYRQPAGEEAQASFQATSSQADQSSASEPDDRFIREILENHFEVAQTLLEEGAHIDGPDSLGRTALTMASADGNSEAVEWLLTHGAAVNAPDGAGRTPLMAASTYYGTAEITELLLNHGALLSAPNPGYADALYLAIETERIQTAQVLIAAGGTLDAGKLIAAARARNIDMIRLLLASGADVNASLPDGLTPLIESTMFNDVEAVNVQLEAGADANAVTTNDSVIKIMRASGADESIIRSTGVTALMLAKQNGNEDLVRRLRDAGARR